MTSHATLLPPVASRHAAQRWAERFPDRDPAELAAALARAVPVPTARFFGWVAAGRVTCKYHPGDVRLHDPVTDALFLADPAGPRGPLVCTVVRLAPRRTRRPHPRTRTRTRTDD